MYKAKTSLGGQNQRVPSALKPIERTTDMLHGCMIVPAIETDPRISAQKIARRYNSLSSSRGPFTPLPFQWRYTAH